MNMKLKMSIEEKIKELKNSEPTKPKNIKLKIFISFIIFYLSFLIPVSLIIFIVSINMLEFLHTIGPVSLIVTFIMVFTFSKLMIPKYITKITGLKSYLDKLDDWESNLDQLEKVKNAEELLENYNKENQ